MAGSLNARDTGDIGPKTFAILLASSAIGGEERFLAELAIAMRRTTTRPIVINLKAPSPYARDLQLHSVDVRSGIANGRLDMVGLVRLVRVLRKAKPDVLLINSNRQAMVFAAIAKLWCRIPVTLVHTHEHQGLAASTIRFMARITDGIVGASDGHCAYLIGGLRLPSDRIVRVYPGINFDRTDNDCTPSMVSAMFEGNGPAVGIVAALRPEKDHETFLKAAALIATQIPEARFFVIGDGPRRRYLEEVARRYGIGARVRFLGWQPIEAGLLRCLDVLVLSSLSETFPAVILEAFSAGVPVVSTDVGSVAELLGIPPCGMLVAPRDPAAIARATLLLLRDRTKAQLIAAAAGQRVKYFSSRRFCRDMLCLVQAIVSSKSAVRRPTISPFLTPDSKGASPDERNAH